MKKNIIGLDILRGFCGYVVAICHFKLIVESIQYYEYISILFVEFFFVLSGFVLAPQILKIINDKSLIPIFYNRRWLRTLPLYILCLIVVSILTNNLFTKDFFYYLFFLNKIFPYMLSNDYFAVAWSLAVEEYFYLIFPIFILFFLDKKNFLTRSIYLFVILNLFAILVCFFVDQNFFRTGTLLRVDSILLGFLTYNYINNIDFKKKFIIIGLTFLIIIYLILYKNGVHYQQTIFSKISIVYLLKLISILTLLLFYTIPFNIKLSSLAKLFANQTYSIYLFHIPLIYLINSSLKLEINLFYYILILFSLSTTIYYTFERPILSLRAKYEKS